MWSSHVDRDIHELKTPGTWLEQGLPSLTTTPTRAVGHTIDITKSWDVAFISLQRLLVGCRKAGHQPVVIIITDATSPHQGTAPTVGDSIHSYQSVEPA